MSAKEAKGLPSDQPVRTELLTDLDSSFVVEAAAGTGKTTVLVSRIVAVVRSGRARLGQLIAVTFTEKAAGEMKLRLREALELAREDSVGADRERLTVAMEELEVARVGTIHGLCADLLREYPVEAEVDPLFEVASENDSDALLQSTFSRWFERALASPDEGVRRLLRRRPRWNDGPPRSQLFSALKTLVEHRDFDGRWRRDPIDRDQEIDALLPRIHDLGALTRKVTQKPEDSWFLNHLGEIQRFASDVVHREALSPRDHDALEAGLHDLSAGFGWDTRPYRVAFEGITADQVVAQRDALYRDLKAFVRRADADLAACLQAELRPVVEAYEEEKSQTGYLDFVDLLLRTRDLVRGHAAVRRSLQERFTHLFVDEFQDTDPLQTELLLLLSADDPNVTDPFKTRAVPGKLFVVGDPKQSVYRFRRADILFYERVKAHLESNGAKVVYLSTSFRSTPAIQAAVNGAFEPAMTGGHHATYVALEKWRESYDKQPSLIALSVPHPYSERGKLAKAAVETSVPEAVAAFIDFLLKKSGWTVLEGDGRVPVQARHVCILFRRFRGYSTEDIPRQYARALEARRVPHVLVGGRSFHVREEVMALRTALWAIERPDDELSVYATLRGPLFALTDDRLLVYRHEVGKLHPLRPLEVKAEPVAEGGGRIESSAPVQPERSRGRRDRAPGEPEPGLEKLSEPAREVYEAMQVLRGLHFERNKRPVADTLHELLAKTRAHAGVAFWNAGDQALANVLQLAELSRRHEKRATSFREVVEALQEEADEGEAPEAPIVEEGTEGVRMMTVHTAKGLEFPIVILAEPTANVARKVPSHWVDPESRVWAQPLAGCVPWELLDHEAEVLDRDLEEAMRLTYVAATRAVDLLVVPAVADKAWPDTWTSVLYPSLYPADLDAGNPTKAPGCPEFKGDAVIDRPMPAPEFAPQPGLHVARTRRNRVVWWDPHTLELEKEDPGGLQRHDALEDNAEAAEPSRALYDAWKMDMISLLRTGATPSVKVIIARELEKPVAPGTVKVEETRVLRQGRPRGKRFGTLVHSVLAQVSLDAGQAELEALSALEARALLASEEERAAAVEAVAAALAHPLLARARSLPPSAVRRETPVVDVLPEAMLEGNVDLAFDDGTTWTVIEFKTDDELEPHLEAYEAQTEAYVRAIESSTGKKARGIILRV